MFSLFSLTSVANGLIYDLETSLGARVNCNDIKQFFKPTIPEFGSDCDSWAELFASKGKYYHAHAGYHTGTNLTAACTGYAGFCPEGKCSFQIAGTPLITPDEKDNTCHALVPYIWSQLPADSANLEPHNGWEYMIAKKNKAGKWKLVRFSEIETTFSVPFDWASPNASDTTWKLDAMQKYSQAQDGECDNAVQPWLTNYFASLSNTSRDDLYRQQGNAVALAAGGICQLVVPYAAMVGGYMEEGKVVFTLKPAGSSYKSVADVIIFKSYQEAAPTPAPTVATCQSRKGGYLINGSCCKGLSPRNIGYGGIICV